MSGDYFQTVFIKIIFSKTVLEIIFICEGYRREKKKISNISIAVFKILYENRRKIDFENGLKIFQSHILKILGNL